MKKIKKPISILLSLILILSVFTIIPIVSAEALDGVSYLDADGVARTANGVTAITSVSAASQYAETSTAVEGGNILHCMCWSYNTILANLDDIKAAGYTAVQTSCIQPPKDYNSYDSTKGNVWWHFYQPVDFCVADGNNWLGTKAELTSLCEAAHEKGIKIIANVVANHMANPGSHGSYNGRSGEINETLLKDESCWHNTGTALTGSDRYDMVMHDNSNLPDLNTANSKVQSMVLSMLKEAIDCGVDGFRFDAAQNIETPRDDDAYKSMFWANTIGEANSYANMKGKTLFSYGEVYNDAWGGDNVLDDYIWYIGHVTEPNIGMEALGGVEGQDSSRVAAVDYKNNRSASNNVLWVESRDSYYSGTGYGGTQTSSVSNDSVVRAWAIIGSRADATALYFARPGSEYVTNATNDTTWKSTAVAEVNKFKNYFRGQSEYLATSGKVAYNERGTSGVVISKLDGEGSVSLTANRMASGTYQDQITGNTFTVSDGKITGTVGSTGVAVVYKAPSSGADSGASFVKVTEEPDDWSGDYLIVYEDEERSTAFNGGSNNIDSAGNYIEVTINNGEIAFDNDTDAAKVTIAQIDGGYSIKTTNDIYIGGNSRSNKIVTSDEAILNTISLDDDGYAVVVSDSAYFRYNSVWSGFRYYKSVSQRPVCLYKLEGGSAPAGETIEINFDSENADVTWGDLTDTDGLWQIQAYDPDTYLVLISNLSSEQAAGTYTWDDLDHEWTFVIDYADNNKKIYFTDGSCTVAVDEGVVTVSGSFTGEDGNTYNVNIMADIAKAPVSVTYIDENGVEQTADATPLDGTETSLDAGWYAVTEDTTISERIAVNGDVHLILCDNATLTATAGIQVNGSG